MSGIEDPGTPPELPEEYANVYRDAYLRALAEEGLASSGDAPQVDQPLGSPPAPLTGRPFWWVLAGVSLVLLLAAWIGWWLFTGGSDEDSGDAPRSAAVSTQEPRGPEPRPSRGTGSAPGPDGEDAQPVWTGRVAPVSAQDASATCTAPEGVDSANQPVTYEVANAFDEDPATAWRCDGRARGEMIVIQLPGGTAIAEVGLVPGYAKDDPVTGVDRYAENNRIIEVRWILADGVVVTQQFDTDPADRSVQRIRVPRTVTDEITLEILGVERGPRNTTAISTVSLAAAS